MQIRSQLITIEGFNWQKSSRNININRQARLFNKTVINIFNNYITNKYVTFNDKDLLWLNDRVRLLIKRKNAIFQKYLKYGKTNANYTNLQASKSELTDAINLSKIKYFKRLDEKLNNPATSSKTYWSTSKNFVNW